MINTIIAIAIFVLILFIVNVPMLGEGNYNYSLYDRYSSSIYSEVVGCDKSIHKQNLYDIDSILKQHKIEFNLSEGTALGAVRDKDIIDNDSDVDLELDYEDIDKVKSIIPDFEDKGFKLSRFWINYSKNGKRINLMSLYRDYHYVDLQFSGYGKYCVSVSDEPPRLCDEFLDHKEPYQYSQIGGKKFKTPSVEYIKFLYGEDWKTPKSGFKPQHIDR